MSSPCRASSGWFLVGAIATLFLVACEPVDHPPLRVLAASSLQPLVTSDPAEADAQISVGASSVLAMQLIAGARADVVLLADPRWMDELEAEGVIVSEARVEVARNRLVLAVPLNGASVIGDDAPAGRVAIAEPRNVPLGRYTMEALQSLGWWTSLEDRFVLASDAKAVLALVESGEVDAGIVYASDASRSQRVEVVRTFDAALHRPIRCEAAWISDREESRRFIERLQGPAGRAMVEAVGFELPLKSDGGSGHE